MSTPTAPTRPPLAPPPERPAPPVTSVPRIALGGALVLLGLAWLAEATGLLAVHWQTVLAVAVVLVGAVLLVTARHGRSDGLVALGILLGVGLVVVGLLPSAPVGAGVGDRVHRPAAVAELEPGYELGAGTLLLDLRALELPPGTTEVAAEVGMGELVVRVPEDVAVDVSATAGAGDLDLLGRTDEGIAPRLRHEEPGGPARLVLDLAAGLGSIEVTR